MKIPLNNSNRSIEYFFHEFKLMQNLNYHPHIIDYKYFVREKKLEEGGFEEIQSSYIVMERMDGGDLK